VGTYRDLYAGWDVARNRDLSVIWLIETVGDISWTRGVIEMRDQSTPSQMAEARKLMPMIRRLVIDKSSMGLTIYEQLYQEFGDAIEGVQFTLATKETLAVGAKRRLEEAKARIPDTPMIRNSFRSVKKTVTSTGQARFDAEHDAQHGHADHFWAFAMAESAAAQPQYGLFELWRLQAEAIERGESAEPGHSLADAQKGEAEIFGNMRMNDRLFWKKRSRTLQCPECGNKNLALHGDVERCNPCGWKHELPAFVFPARFS